MHYWCKANLAVTARCSVSTCMHHTVCTCMRLIKKSNTMTNTENLTVMVTVLSMRLDAIYTLELWESTIAEML